MKKSLVLAMAMALGVTASAYAANPFSDVPAGHWAYDSISKLAAAGIIEGYGDDTFRGDRLMTRYEMAQIVAKALAKGANVDKLAAEFADELDALGVRVAALEKKSDNVKITGQIRYHYASVRHSGTVGDNSHQHQLRTRIWLTGKVNDNWNYRAKLENRSNLADNVGNENTAMQEAHLQGRLGGVNVTAGRYNYEDPTGGNIWSNRVDGIQASYGSKIKLTAQYNKLATVRWQRLYNGLEAGTIGGTSWKLDENGNEIEPKDGYAKSWGVSLSGELGKNVKLYAGFDKFFDHTNDVTDDNGIFDVGLNARFKDITLDAIYLHGNSKDANNKNGFIAGLTYKGASFNKVGSWDISAKYYNQGDGTFVSHETDGTIPDYTFGFKGMKYGAHYVPAKGMMLGVVYYDWKSKETSAKDRTLWTELQLRF